jgi:WD40 repeat protein/mono/diheme cytochrome c family protein
MIDMTRFIFFAAAALAGLAGRTSRADEASEPTYEKQIAPFFKTYCVGCHDGGDDSKGGLSLLSFQTLMEGGDGGQVLVAGKSDESRLLKVLLGAAKPKMPPKDSKQPMAEEIAAVKRWVDRGAKGPTSTAPQSASELKVRHIAPQTGVAAAVSAVAFSPDGRQLAAAEGLASVAGHVRIWTIGNPAARTLTGHTDSIYAIEFNPAGDRIVTAAYDKLLIIWDAASGKELQTLKHHTGAVFGATFSPDGKLLASVAADQTAKLWNVDTGQRIATFTEATKGLSAIAFHPRGHEFSTGGVDKMIRTYEWNGTTARLKRSAFAHDAPILSLVYSPNGEVLYTGSEDRRIKAWEGATLQERRVYDLLPDWPQTLAVNRAGTSLAAGLANGDVKLFDTGRADGGRDLLKGGRPTAALLQPTGPAGTRPDARAPLPAGALGSLQFPIFNLQAPLLAASLGQQPEATEQPKPNPPMPRLDAVSPRTVVRGNKIKFTLSGQNIRDADRLFVSPPHLPVMLLPGDEKNPNQAFCEIEIPADMSPGMVSVRLHTPLGSTAGKSFYVGPFGEIGEKEDNSKPDSATPTTLPATLVGTIASKGDSDLWTCEAQAGQELAFVLIGPALGSSLNARLTLLDGDGRPLETATRQPWKSEVVVTHRFDTAQKCVLRVEDRDFTGGGNHFYYIQAGPFPYVTSAYPLGMASVDTGAPAGDQVQSVEVRGPGIPAGTRLIPVAGTGARFPTLDAPAGKSLNSARFESSPNPEYAELEPNDAPAQARLLPAPSGISGKIAAAGDSDLVAFDAKRGERLTIETLARRLGSPLDSVIDILDAAGKPVPRFTLRAVAETYTVLRDHDSRARGIRLQHWEDIVPNDLVMLGGEIVKVQILPLGPDEDVFFFNKGGIRLGYLGTTPEAHAINSAAYKVEIHPPGTPLLANGMPMVTLGYQNDDGGPGIGSDSQILFDVPADGRYLVRVRDVRGIGGDDFFYRLVVRPRQEDFRISLDPENPNIPRGGSLPVTVNLDRLDGFNGPVDVRIEGLPEGITATATRIGPDLFNAVLTLTSSNSAGEPAAASGEKSATAEGTDTARTAVPIPLMFRTIASAAIGGKVIEHPTTPGFGIHQVSVTSPPDLRVTVEPQVATIVPGQELKFTVTVERRNAFAGRVPVEVLNLPHGLHVIDVGLNGVLINETEVTRSFVVACDPWAPAGPLLFYAAPKVEAKNERHASQPIRLDVRTAPSVAEK